MTKRTLTRRAISLAIGSTLALATAAAMNTATAASDSPGLNQEYCVIGSVSVLLACPSTVADPSVVGSIPSARKAPWELRTDSAYVAVYAYYCAPTFHDRLATAEEPNGIEVAIYTDRFRVEYGSDCRDFYLNEVAPRLAQP